ncbi:MAG: trypsin-like peptidase domain-containing protein, partial [bacterium]|nr:trypsin-like peptidase domain-containing protein [bacterium]
MNRYELPSFNVIAREILEQWNARKQALTRTFFIAGLILLSAFSGMVGSYIYLATNGHVIENITSLQKENSQSLYVPQTTQEEKIVDVVKNASPAVVSIIITKDVPIVEQYFTDPFQNFFGDSPFQFQVPQYRQLGTEKKEVGGGSGFIVSEDGFVLTNKHVVIDEKADYTVFTTDGKSYPAKVLAKDPVQDLAVLKISQDEIVGEGGLVTKKPFSKVQLGNSDGLQIGQTVIAIGNALGEFRNTVSVGVISGLGRTVTASGGDFVETIEDVIQTDAAINKGNSGGPLLNLAGQVIGVNTATVLDAQSIGFAVPSNKAKRDIEQVKNGGKIIYPFLGVRYLLLTEKLGKEKDLSVDYGALIQKGSQGEKAVEPGSAAQKAGLREGDVILEVGGEKVTQDN